MFKDLCLCVLNTLITKEEGQSAERSEPYSQGQSKSSLYDNDSTTKCIGECKQSKLPKMLFANIQGIGYKITDIQSFFDSKNNDTCCF